MLQHTIVLIIIIALLVCMIDLNDAKKKRKVQGPRGMSRRQSTNCKEFSKFARFNPYSVLNETWFVFFYWAAPRPIQTYRFYIPTENHIKILHTLLDGKVTVPVNWTARNVILQDRFNKTWLLVERGDRGQYWSYLPIKNPKRLIEVQDIRLRQHDNGRLLGLMDCASEHLYIMSRIREVPPQSKLQDEAARFGFRARRGKSYLYQGHEWMPVPELDEEDFFETIIPDVTNDTIGADKITLTIAESEEQKPCDLKNPHSKHKMVDLDYPDININTKNHTNINELKAKTEEVNFESAQETPEIGEDDSDNAQNIILDNITLKQAGEKEVEITEGTGEEISSDKASIESVNPDALGGENTGGTIEQKYLNGKVIEDNSNSMKEDKVDFDKTSATLFDAKESENIDQRKGIGEEGDFKKTEEDTDSNRGKTAKVEADSKTESVRDSDKLTNDKTKGSADSLKEMNVNKKTKSLLPADERTNYWGSERSKSHASFLKPVASQIYIEPALPEGENPLTSGKLPEKCYKMQYMEGSDEITPAYVPPVFNVIQDEVEA